MELMRIALTSLSRYNNGELVFEWVDLTATNMTEIEEVMARLGGEEFFISDYESPFGVDEHENIEKLIEFAEFIDGLDEWDLEKAIFVEDQGIVSDKYDLMDFDFDDVEYYPDVSLVELAEQFVDEGIYGEISSAIIYYIDYEAIARDLGMEYVETDKGCFRAY